MPERVDGGRLLAAIGALALLVALFLPWFGGPGGSHGGSLTAWTAFELVDLLLAALAVAALGSAMPERTGVPSTWLAWIGALMVLLVFVAIVNHPPAAIGRSLDYGAWVALGGTLLVLAGAVLTTTRISLVITLRDRGDGGAPGHHDPPAYEPYDAVAEDDPEYEEYEPVADEEPLPPEGDGRTETMPLEERRPD